MFGNISAHERAHTVTVFLLLLLPGPIRLLLQGGSGFR